MVTCTRVLEFDYAHRVLRHESKCAHVHGHRGKVEITAHGLLDSVGRVIDFSVLKEKIGGWIDRHWDHNAIVFREDVDFFSALRSIEGNREPFVADWNPTAENMAEYLLNVVCPRELRGTGVTVLQVVLHETPNGRATARHS